MGRLRRNVAGVLQSMVDTAEDIYDSTGAWRQRTLAGTLHSGELVSDSRSDDRTSF
jgi:deaminated glutathione amidase